MALEDILFLDGDRQLFIFEIEGEQVRSPVDISFDKYFLIEIPINFLVFTSLDYLFDKTSCEEFPKNKKNYSVTVL